MSFFFKIEKLIGGVISYIAQVRQKQTGSLRYCKKSPFWIGRLIRFILHIHYGTDIKEYSRCVKI